MTKTNKLLNYDMNQGIKSIKRNRRYTQRVLNLNEMKLIKKYQWKALLIELT